MATPYNPYDANRSMALPSQQQVESQRKADRQANQRPGPKARPSHLKALAEARKIPRVRVEPATPELREVLKHPNGMAFRSQGSVEWPLDSFTQRRERDGSIRIVSGTAATQQRSNAEAEERIANREQRGGRKE
jgi:hypothetical protein